jgi:hypothetical protein
MQQVKTTRIYWRTQLVALHSIILAMTKFRDISNISNRYDSKLADYAVVPNSYDLAPQDRLLDQPPCHYPNLPGAKRTPAHTPPSDGPTAGMR